MNRRLISVIGSLGLFGIAMGIALGPEFLFARNHLRAPEVDWPGWRGPERNAVSKDANLLTEWKAEPPKVWGTDGFGRGFSSIAIHEGRIFTMGMIQGMVSVVCAKLEDGTNLWTTPIARGKDPNSTPTVDGDRVYALDCEGNLVCLNTEDGKEIWRKSYSNDFGGYMMSHWGYSESPLIDGDRLICTPGGNEAALVALDKKTGELIWKTTLPELGNRGKDGAGYASVMISEVDGLKQYVTLLGRGVVGVRASDGEFLWGYNKVANGTANIPTPVVHENLVFCSSGYGTGAALLRLKKNGERIDYEEVYFLNAKTLQNHHGGMILVDGYLYTGHGHNKGAPICIELETGNVVWHKEKGPGDRSAAIVYADGHLYFRYENGVMALIEGNPKGYSLKGKFEIPEAGSAPSWSHPVVVGGMMFLREQENLFCYDIRAK